VLRYRGASLALVFLPQHVVGDAALGYLVTLALREAVDSGLTAGVGGALALSGVGPASRRQPSPAGRISSGPQPAYSRWWC